MNCACTSTPSSSGVGRFFTKNSRRYLRTYRRKGLAKEQRMLADGIRSTSPGGKALLEIGCGVGALHLTLLREGAGSAVGVDAAEGMIGLARNLAREEGLEGRTSYHVGDFVALHADLPEADITILDKVVCCCEEIDDLVDLSAAKTRSVYALSFPRQHIVVKWIWSVPIIAGKILKWSFRPYWHDWEQMLANITRSGFRECFAGTTLMWSVRVFRREAQRH